MAATVLAVFVAYGEGAAVLAAGSAALCQWCLCSVWRPCPATNRCFPTAGIGANDFANSFGSSVGSGALTSAWSVAGMLAHLGLAGPAGPQCAELSSLLRAIVRPQ